MTKEQADHVIALLQILIIQLGYTGEIPIPGNPLDFDDAKKPKK